MQPDALERDIQVARQIQAGFLPPGLPQPAGWELAAEFEPAREVAGDFYDAFALPRGKIGLVIADVCDKGIGAALFMALCRSLIRAYAQEHRPLNWLDEGALDIPVPARNPAGRQRWRSLSAGDSSLLAVSLTSQYICDNHADMAMFATLFFGVLDPGSGSLVYVNAGHEAPLVVTATGQIKARLRPTGPAIGILPGAEFGMQQVALDSGDILLAYTDGVTDAHDPAGVMFSEARLLALAQSPAPSARALLDRIVAGLRECVAGAEPFDDVTLLAARWNTACSPGRT